MLINNQNISFLYTGFKTAFQRGLGQAQTMWNSVATEVPSAAADEKYGWLGKLPNVREWIGDREVQNLTMSDYSIKNKSYELTIGVDRDNIADDQYGVYGPLFEEFGRSVAAHPDQLVFSLLKAGFAANCYDGQYFFDTDHPVVDATGATVSVSNSGGGSGAPWFLIDDSRVLKPLIYQVRKPFGELVRKDRTDDDNVFYQKSLIYGVDGRCNVGFGFWQFAYGSKQTLDKAAYAAARAAMMSFTGDGGRPLGITPRLLVVSPTLESAAMQILNAEYDAAGASNVWKGTSRLLVCPWLV
jgi:phage major head subunit gpT-like protein